MPICRKEQPHEVGHLRRGPDRQLAGAVLGDQAARLYRRARGAVVDDPSLDHDVGVGERLLDVASAHRPLVRLVRAERLVHERLVPQRLLDVDDDRQRLVLDVHLLRRVDDRVLVHADDHRDPLADVADLAARQRPALGRRDLHAGRRPRHRQRRQQVGHVLADVDRPDTAVRQRSRGVDRDDPRVCLGRAHDRGVQHAVQGDVVDVLRAAADQARVLLAAQRAADVLGGCLLDRAHAATARPASAAAWTALTMF
jgi:hypothetical protein